MSEKVIENNKVSVIGEIISGFTFSHEVFGEGFYLVNVAVSRLSEQADIIPLMISERLLDVKEDYIGCTVEAIGQFRSYNRHEGVKNRLVLSVFVREIHFMEKFTDYTKTNRMASPTISPALPGAETRGLPLALRSEPGYASGAVSRAGNTPKSSVKRSVRSAWPMKFPSAN